MMSILAGKRTYILATAAVLTSFANFLAGGLSLAQFLNEASMGAGLGTLRASIR